MVRFFVVAATLTFIVFAPLRFTLFALVGTLSGFQFAPSPQLFVAAPPSHIFVAPFTLTDELAGPEIEPSFAVMVVFSIAVSVVASVVVETPLVKLTLVV